MFYMWISSFLKPFLKGKVSSPMYVSGTFVENQMAIAVWVYFWVLYSISLVSASVFMSVPYWFC
jgi:hypothetical protein